MKRTWHTYLLVGGLGVLIALLATLQYRWLNQISESEGEKAHKRVQEQTDRFAMDFNREIQGAYFNFQTDSDNWKDKTWTAFNQRYDFWSEKTSYPGLITDFYFFEADGASPLLRYDRPTRTFVPADASPDIARLRTRLSEQKEFTPLDQEDLTLVLPIQKSEPMISRTLIRIKEPPSETPTAAREKFGYLAIKLDPATIKEKLLPDLNAMYFGDGEFRIAVDDQSGQPVFQSIKGDKADAAAPLFDLSSDNFVYFANRELLSAVGADVGTEHKADVVLNRHVESHTFNRGHSTGEGRSSMKMTVVSDSLPRDSVFTGTASGEKNIAPWTLQVQHVSGSLDGYLAGTLRRNLAVGFGILFMLGAAIFAIVISAQRAKRLGQRQIDFVSSVSHEFRTPLAVIYTAGENLADGVAAEGAQVSRYGELIKGEGKKLSTMVEQILEFAGADSGRKKYSFAATPVADVVNDALAGCRPLFDEKGIDVETNISGTLPVIRADRSALSGAIQNLIVNSVKYGNGDAWLRVTAENGGDMIKISVEDRGIGISKRDIRQIFEPFYRSKEVVDAQIHGNGLGLSLVKQITEAHGGRVAAESEKGAWSRFTIEIPSGNGQK